MNIPSRKTLRQSWHSWLQSDSPRAGPYWLQLAWTGIFSLVIAMGFTLLGFALNAKGWAQWTDVGRWAQVYGKNLVISATVAYMIHAFFEIGGRLVGGSAAFEGMAKWQRLLYFGGLPMLAVSIGWPAGLWLAGVGGLEVFSGDRGRQTIVLSLSFALLLTAFSYQYFGAKSRALLAERQATEAQLRLLQAQIEPHFLFNTLANVQSLMDHDLPKAKQMLQAFTDYLRVSLGALRRDEGLLSQELDLARSYLLLQQGRMDDRLRFEINAEEAALEQHLPPLLLQPLVENAVQHGLEPNIDGGTVKISARLISGQLVLQVHDDGQGLNTTQRPGARRGNGVALDNIRQRLQARYGEAARLEISAANPGTCASISLPLQATNSKGPR